jgi:lysosomal acid lipase/cholesteryl ester hydrolase
MAGSARQFIALGKGSYADRIHSYGFDVWLANWRDTSYTRPSGKSYTWGYTWEDMAFDDLSQQIDFVLSKTGFSKLNYIGHSMGSAMIYYLLSSRPEY